MRDAILKDKVLDKLQEFILERWGKYQRDLVEYNVSFFKNSLTKFQQYQKLHYAPTKPPPKMPTFSLSEAVDTEELCKCIDEALTKTQNLLKSKLNQERQSGSSDKKDSARSSMKTARF